MGTSNAPPLPPDRNKGDLGAVCREQWGRTSDGVVGWEVGSWGGAGGEEGTPPRVTTQLGHSRGALTPLPLPREQQSKAVQIDPPIPPPTGEVISGQPNPTPCLEFRDHPQTPPLPPTLCT